MQIGEPMLQLLLYKRAQADQAKFSQSETTAETAQAVTAESAVAATSTSPTSEDYAIANEFAMSSINSEKRISIAVSDSKLLQQHAITVSALSQAEITQIKQTIYNLHHGLLPAPPGGGSGGGTEPPGGTETPETPTTPTPAGNISFISDFGNVDELFTYMNTIDSTIDKTSGLNRDQLWEFTQRDDWENDAFNDNFFGRLNLGFNSIDTNGDGTLSYEEICNFIGEEMTASEYADKVEQYSDSLQSQFITMTPSEKLNFAIEKAREYLEQVGLTEQISALNRLIAENKLGFADLNPGKTYDPSTGGWYLGAYSYYLDDTGTYWAGDDDFFYDQDEDGYDDYYGGIYLDQYYYCEKPDAMWYDLTATLIHELTHATASFHPTSEVTWGEYVAYQVEEDYLDSIGKGQWSGANEKSGISNHITTYYTDEPVPSGKWWTYGNYA